MKTNLHVFRSILNFKNCKIFNGKLRNHKVKVDSNNKGVLTSNNTNDIYNSRKSDSMNEVNNIQLLFHHK